MNDRAEHWFINGMRGVNLVTLIVLILGGAKLYFDLTKDVALVQRDIVSMQRDVGSVQSDLDRIQRRLRIGSYDPGWSFRPGRPSATGISE